MIFQNSTNESINSCISNINLNSFFKRCSICYEHVFIIIFFTMVIIFGCQMYISIIRKV